MKVVFTVCSEGVNVFSSAPFFFNKDYNRELGLMHNDKDVSMQGRCISSTILLREPGVRENSYAGTHRFWTSHLPVIVDTLQK